jgi:hypothetical protein
LRTRKTAPRRRRGEFGAFAKHLNSLWNFLAAREGLSLAQQSGAAVRRGLAHLLHRNARPGYWVAARLHTNGRRDVRLPRFAHATTIAAHSGEDSKSGASKVFPAGRGKRTQSMLEIAERPADACLTPALVASPLMLYISAPMKLFRT